MIVKMVSVLPAADYSGSADFALEFY